MQAYGEDMFGAVATLHPEIRLYTNTLRFLIRIPQSSPPSWDAGVRRGPVQRSGQP